MNYCRIGWATLVACVVLGSCALPEVGVATSTSNQRAAPDAGLAMPRACPDTRCSEDCVKLNSDPHHCGACENDCGVGACDNSMCAPEIIATSTAYAQIAVDDDAVYWLSSQGELYKLPHSARLAKSGGGADLAQVLAVETHAPSGLALDATTVFYTYDDGPQGSERSGAILSIPKAGGNVTPLATGRPTPSTLAVAGGNVYWVEVDARANSGSVVSTNPRDGLKVIATFQPAPNPSAPQAIAIAATHLYWNNADGQLTDIDLTSGRGNPVQRGARIAGVGADAEALYWIDSSQGLMRVLFGSTASVVFDRGSGGDSVAIAGDEIFWSSDPGVRAVAKHGKGAPLLITNFRGLWLAATEQWVYGSTGDKLWRLKRAQAR